MASHSRIEDSVTDFNYFCSVVAASALCGVCKTILIKRYIDERTAGETKILTGETRVDLPSFREAAPADDVHWSNIVLGNTRNDDLRAFVGSRYGRSWEEFRMDAEPTRDFERDWQKANLVRIKARAAGNFRFRRDRFNDWASEFARPVTFQLRQSKPLTFEWEAKMWFACEGIYTLQDLAEGRDYEAFAKNHGRLLIALENPELEDCECPGRLPASEGAVIKVEGAGAVEKISHRQDPDWRQAGAVLRYTHPDIAAVLRLACSQESRGSSAPPAPSTFAPRSIDEILAVWSLTETQEGLESLRRRGKIAKESAIMFFEEQCRRLRSEGVFPEA